MAQNLEMIPEKRDYLVVNGSPVPSDRALEAAYFALTIPQNKWIYGQENQGSLLYTLENQKRSNSIEQQFASYSIDAVKRQVVSTGQVSAVDAINIEATRYGSSNQVRIQPVVKVEQDEFSFIPLS